MGQDEVRIPSREEILQWMNEAEAGNAEAQCKLGECYEDGYGVKPSLGKARYWYTKAAEQGYIDAQENLEMLDVAREQAEQWIHEAEQGDPDVLYRLAEWYEVGIGVERDYKMAKKYYTRAFKAKEEGDYIDRFFDKRHYQWRMAYLDTLLQVEAWEEMAEQGDTNAMILLSKYYEYDATNEEELNPERAIYWLRKATERGYAKAQVLLGSHYELGIVVFSDYKEAFRLYMLAAEQDDAWGQYEVGHCYERGIGTEKNIEEAIRWYAESAMLGDMLSVESLERIRDYYALPEHQNLRNTSIAQAALEKLNDKN